MTELRGLPFLPIVELAQGLDRVHSIDGPEWDKARQRELIFREALQGDG